MQTAETPIKDLFLTPSEIPFEVRQILEKHEDELNSNDLKTIERVLVKVQQAGYTFDYNSGGRTYDLRKIEFPISPQKRKQIDQQSIPIIREKLRQSEEHLMILLDCISDIKPTLRPYLNDRINMKKVDIAAYEIKLKKLMRNVQQ